MTGLIEINLLPIEDRKTERDFSYILDAKTVLPTLLIILSLIAYQIIKIRIKTNLEKKKESVALLQRDINKERGTLMQIKKQEKLLRDMNAKNHSLNSIRHNRQLWVRILEGLSKNLPANSWISDVKQQSERTLTISGSTFLFSEVAFYMIDLEKEAYFQDVILTKIETDPAKETDAFRFFLKIELNLNVIKTGTVNPNPQPASTLARL